MIGDYNQGTRDFDGLIQFLPGQLDLVGLGHSGCG